MTCDFSLRHYRELLQAAKVGGYRWAGFDAPPSALQPSLNSLDTLDGRLTMVVWTRRGTARRVISMRYCNEREQKRFEAFIASF